MNADQGTSDVIDTRRHVPALDGVRGLAAIGVMLFHFGRAEVPGTGAAVVALVTQYGWAGVDLFFVLSGFLIGGILLDTRDRPGFLRTFYKRRALRIFPLYYAFVALYLFLIVPVLPGPPADVVARQGWLWSYLVNFDVALHGWYAGVGSHANGLWSLAIEEQFYLVAPFAVLWLSRRGLTILAIVGVVGSIAARIALEQAGLPGRVGYVVTFARVDALSIGILLALAARHGDMLSRLAKPARVALAASLVFVLAFTSYFDGFSNEHWRTLQIGLPAFTLACAAILVLAVSPAGSPLLRRVFESRALRFFGIYSYSLYIWHPLVGRLVRLTGFSQTAVANTTGSTTAAVLAVLVVKIAASIVLALVSYQLIERPFLRLKGPDVRAAAEPVPAPSTAIAPT